MIVHVTDCFYPRLGGIEIQVEDLARAQRDSGEAVRVITATPSLPDVESDHGFPVHRVTAPLPWELPVHPRAGTHLDRLFDELRPDVVHVHVGCVAPFAWSAVRCSLRRGLPTVVTVHSMWGRASQAMYRTLDRVTGWSSAPLVLTAVSTAAATLVNLAAPGVTATVVPNGITPGDWGATPRTEAGRPGTPVHVVAIGRLAPRKEPMTLLKALRVAQSRLGSGVRLRATIAGNGPAGPAMQRYLRRNAMTGWVRLAGRLDRSDIRSLLGSADLFLNPTVRESFGIATLEARAAGVPVVARAGNGIADFIRTGQEGVLGHSVAELIDGLTWLAADHDARGRMRAHNSSVAPKHCAWPTVVAQFAECYTRTASLATSRGAPLRPTA